MKTLLLVDFGHLSARMIHTSAHLMKPKKKDGKFITAEFMPMVYNLVLNSLRYAKKRYKADEVIVLLDGYGSWRKDVYPEYKGNRGKDKAESDIDWKEVYEGLNILTDVMQKDFPFKVIGKDKVEADDGIGIITQHYHDTHNIVILSEDKDFKQLLLLSNVKLAMPIKKIVLEMRD